MSQKGHEDAREAITEFQKLFADYQKQVAQAQEAERKRRAALTPAQRAAEDRAKTEKATQLERQKLTRKFAAMGDRVRKADTWTIADFCWLLLAESPAVDEWSFFDGRSSKAAKQHREYCAVIESCVHTRIKPVNPTEAPNKHRFTVQSLMLVARDKQLGYVSVLADIMGFGSEPAAASTPEARKPTPAANTLAALGTESRERQRIRRRKQLLEMARSLAEDGDGTVHPTHIALAMNGKELAERFKKKFPEWKYVSERTLEADRTGCKPRIGVATGRPRKSPT